MKIYDELIKVLKNDERFCTEEGELLKNKIYDAAMKMDKKLITDLSNNRLLKDKFFVVINDILIFDKTEFGWVVKNKEFLPSSFTKYKNKIGLIDAKGEFISDSNDVELVFPYKDCILEGGQTKEEQKNNEVFYNEVLSSNEIDRLMYPKVLTNAHRYSLDGDEKIDEINPNENLIIKGNNLLAISSLLKKYEGKVNLIIIDPPYNTNTDSFKYNDKFTHSAWLVFMKNRLEIAKKLLSEDGSIYVQIDNKEAHYLKVLMDDIFGRNNFRSEIIWDTSIPYVAGNKWLSNNWIYSYSSIFYYAKNKEKVKFNKLTFDVKQKSGDISKKPYKDVWTDIENFAGFLGAKDIKINFNSRKPEKLLERIIKASSDEGDLILDFFGGSGTTLAVAHKMNRRYIGVEQMESQIDIIINRLNEVIKGEEKGVSNSVDWNGGGSFVYCELAKLNEKIIEKIEECNDDNELIDIFREIKNTGFVTSDINISEINVLSTEFQQLTILNKKELLLKILDKNQLYVNFCDIQDKEFNISESDKKFTNSFYKEV